MRRLQTFPPRLRLWMILMLLAGLGLSTLPTKAIEVPPPGLPTYIQTNAADATLGRGDWYTNAPAGGGGGGYHYVTFNVPCNWPTTAPIYVDLFSPEMNSNNPLSDEATQGNMLPEATQFELYGPGTVYASPAQPGPGAPGSLGAVTYPPQNTVEQWVRFQTIAAPVACGTYIVRSQANASNVANSRDENAWRLRVGTDNDNDPNNAPPANYDNPDGIAGTNDELTIGVAQVAYQHNNGATNPGRCLTLYQFVAHGSTSTAFHNFDLDASGDDIVRYYPPSAPYDASTYAALTTGGIAGTASVDSRWNNSPTDPNLRVGDIITPIAPATTLEGGWWKIVTCVNDNNQYIQEGQQGKPTYFTQPPTPRMIVGKTDGKTVTTYGDQLNYTIAFTNTSNQTPTPGAALNVILTDTLPLDTTYVANSCAVNAPYTGTCTLAGTNVIFRINESVNAGASGTVRFSVTVNNGAPETITNNVVLTYKDGLGNNYPPETANDTDIILSDLAISKTDGGISSFPGGVIRYTLTYTSTGPNITNVVITETVPVNTTFNTGASTAGWVCTPNGNAGSTCTFALGTLTNGTVGTVVFAVTVDNPLPTDPPPTQISNTATIGGDGSETSTTNNQTTDTTPLLYPDVFISKGSNPVSGTVVRPNDIITYSMIITSTGQTTATNVLVSDAIPNGTTYVAGSANPAVTTGPDPLTWSIPALPVGQSRTFTFQVTVVTTPTDGFVTNQALVSADNIPVKFSNNIRHPFTPTAIDLVSFNATAQTNAIAVRWVTSAELDTWGFRILRSTTNNRADAVVVTPSLIAAQGRNKAGASYEWLDTSAVAGTEYYYWLQEVELSGATNDYGPAQAMLQAFGNVRIFMPFVTR